MDAFPLVSRYLGHLNKAAQDTIRGLSDTKPVALGETMSAALDREAGRSS